MGCYVLVIMIMMFLRWWYKRQNDLRDKRQLQGQHGDSDLVDSFGDLTDRVSCLPLSIALNVLSYHDMSRF